VRECEKKREGIGIARWEKERDGRRKWMEEIEGRRRTERKGMERKNKREVVTRESEAWVDVGVGVKVRR